MAAPSPAQKTGSVVDFQIKINGNPVDSSIQVRSILVWSGVNKLPKAKLAISDGSAATETFAVSESSAFVPGNTIEILIGYDSALTTVFSGIIYRQGVEVSQNGTSTLLVEATDKAMAMTLARRNAIYEKKTDSQIISTLIGQSGLSASVTATTTTYETIVQYYASDWDLMLIRAQINGMVVTVDGAKVTVAPPDTTAAPVLTLTYGDSVLDARMEMDAATQYAAAAIGSYAWDPATQSVAASGKASASVSEQGNITSEQLAKVFGIAAYPQQTAGTLETAALTSWSSAELLKSRLSKIRGHLTFAGSALAKPGCMVTVDGFGSRFDGNAYVSGVTQRLEEGFWKTSVEIGLSAEWFSATAPQIAAPGAAGQLPPVPHLQTGLVQQIDKDPDGEFRVLVTLPLLQVAGKVGVWARLGSFYASNGFGAQFYPELGDEVAVAFMNNDPRYPVILGSLYSKKNPPPVTPEAKNNQKTIVTKSKLKLDFFEDEKAVEISTPGGQSLRIDDKGKKITVKDINGSTLTMEPSGVTLASAADLKMTAKGNVQVTAGGSMTLKAGTTLTLEGVNVAAKAQSGFSAQGSAEAKLTSSGIVTVQGTLVKIN